MVVSSDTPTNLCFILWYLLGSVFNPSLIMVSTIWNSALSVRRYLEKGGGEDEDKNASTINGLPLRFFERFIMQDLRVDLIEPGRLICTFKVPQRLLVLTLLLKTHFSISLSLSLFIAFTFSSYWVIQRRPISLYDKTRTTLVSVCEKLFKIRPLIAEKIWEQ